MADTGPSESGDKAPSRLDVIDLAHLAIQSLPYGVLIADRSGRILLANREVERQFGYRLDELKGQPIEMLVRESTQAAHVAHREAFAAHPETRPLHGRCLTGRRRNASDFPLEIGLYPVESDNGLLVLTLIRDLDAKVFPTEGEFERFVADRAAHFINLPSGKVNEAMLDMLREVVLALGIDRGTLLEIRGTELMNPVRWTRPGLPEGLPSLSDARERFPWVFESFDRNETTCFSSVDQIQNPSDRESFTSLGIKSGILVPLWVQGELVGAANFFTLRAERTWPADVVSRLHLVGSVLGTTLARRQADTALQTALADVERLKDQLQGENLYLRSEVRELRGTTRLVDNSAAVRKLLRQVRQVAPTDTSVLLTGETGTGKELLAELIHELSARRGHAMVRVNCAALPPTLLESELFGREKGAYTGADSMQIGRFELANESTLFLDEIGDLPADAQVKLLRVLEQRTIERLGNSRTIRVNVRVIAATNRDVEQLVGEGRFREDLYYRLNVFPLRVPPLRERVEDIPGLVWHFVGEISAALGKRITAIPKDSMTALQRYAWPGNVRELRNVIERAIIVGTGPQLTITPPVPAAAGPLHAPVKLTDVEREHIRRVLERSLWRIRGPGGAAEQLGMKPTTLETRMAKLGLTRPVPEP
jgi:formate hydrogenlyase transcriptional activator